MTRTGRFLVLLATALLAPAAARAQVMGLRFEKSIYADEKDVALKAPEGVACTEGGALVVADTGNGRLLLFNYKDGLLSGGTPIKLPQLAQPVRLQLDSKGDLLVLDRKARKIGRVDVKRAFAGWLEVKGVADSGAVVPGAFRLDEADNVHLLDVAARRVLVLAPDGKVVRELPLPRQGEFTDVAVDGSGRVYVVDAAEAAIWVAEKGASSFQPLGKGMKDRMSFPAYAAVDRGRILVVDQNGMGVVVVSLDGAYQGRELSLGWNDGQLFYPAQLCLPGTGDAFLADRQNHRVQIFTMRK